MSPITITLIVVLAIVFLLLGWGVACSNGIKRLDLKCKEALADIDVALMKRHDSLTKLVDVVKGYQKHEIETLTQITAMRAGMAMNERVNATKQMNDLMGRINLVAENYPELRSNANFRQLQTAIMDTEEHLQAARRLYNSNVNQYNQKLVVFPDSIIAGMIGAQQKSFFEVPEANKQDVKMDF